MKLEKIIINNKISSGQVFDSDDYTKFKDIYKQWTILNTYLEEEGSRALNVPDILSEGLFCYLFNVHRVNATANSLSYDAYDIKNKKGIQIKSTSIDNDLTSFGPKTVWDELYFIRFYPKDKKGKVEIYNISNFDFSNFVLNKKKGETFAMQQSQGKRPRFSIIKRIIQPNNLKPIAVVYLLEDEGSVNDYE